MWFWLAIIALLCWSGSDLFSKIGCRDASDKNAHLKMVVAVGVVMGLHAAYEIFIGGTVVTWNVIWTYLPVSLLYISSMTLGYVGLRYIELSISSPICNSSGALVAVLCLITGTLDESIQGAMRWAVIGAVALVCIGVIGLGVVESREDDELRRARQEASIFSIVSASLSTAPVKGQQPKVRKRTLRIWILSRYCSGRRSSSAIIKLPSISTIGRGRGTFNCPHNVVNGSFRTKFIKGYV